MPARRSAGGSIIPSINGSDEFLQEPGALIKTLRVMRLTAILLTAFCVQVSASGLSQKISFSGENVRLQTIFKAIEKQTGYFVVYDPQLLANSQPVTVRMQNVTLKELLDYILKDQLLTYSFKKTTIFIKKS